MLSQNTKSVSTRALVITFIVAAVLELALAPQISLWGGAINFMVVAALALSVCVEPGTAGCIGFISGLFFDLTSSTPVGLMSLLLTLAAYLASSASQGITPGFNLESMRVTAVAVLAVNLTDGLALYLMGSESSLLYALGVHALVSTVLDVLVLVPFLAALGTTVQSSGFSARGSSPSPYTASSGRPSRRTTTPRKASKKSKKHGSHAAGTRYKFK